MGDFLKRFRKSPMLCHVCVIVCHWFVFVESVLRLCLKLLETRLKQLLKLVKSSLILFETC